MVIDMGSLVYTTTFSYGEWELTVWYPRTKAERCALHGFLGPHAVAGQRGWGRYKGATAPP